MGMGFYVQKLVEEINKSHGQSMSAIALGPSQAIEIVFNPKIHKKGFYAFWVSLEEDSLFIELANNQDSLASCNISFKVSHVLQDDTVRLLAVVSAFRTMTAAAGLGL